MSVPTKHNLKAHVIGTGEFRFSLGATSAADALAKGYRDFGNIVAFSLEPENTLEEHEGSYRGQKIVDLKYLTKKKFDYLLTCDEWKRNLLSILVYGSDGTSWTQSALAAETIDNLAFTAQALSSSDLWYDLTKSGTRVRSLTSVALSSDPTVNVTADADTDKITETGTTRQNGDPIVFQGTAAPTGLTLGTVYYVRDVATNDFKVAAAVGGAAINLTSAGTSVTVRSALVKDTDYEEDLQLGCVRFLTQRSATVYVVATADAITATDATSYKSLIPMASTQILGYGRLIAYDQNAGNTVVWDHQDFPCQLTPEKPGSIDGKKPAEFGIRVSITSEMADFGKLWVREENDEPA